MGQVLAKRKDADKAGSKIEFNETHKQSLRGLLVCFCDVMGFCNFCKGNHQNNQKHSRFSAVIPNGVVFPQGGIVQHIPSDKAPNKLSVYSGFHIGPGVTVLEFA